MAVQRDIPVPDSQSEQIELYKVYLENHSNSSMADDEAEEEDECKMIDELLSDDDSSDSEDDDVSMVSGDESDTESVAPPPKKVKDPDAEIEGFKSTIKKLREELNATKRLLKSTQRKHCEAARQRHVLRELQTGHELTVKDLNCQLNEKTETVVQLTEDNAVLKGELIQASKGLKRLLYGFEDRMHDFEKLCRQKAAAAAGGGGGGTVYTDGASTAFTDWTKGGSVGGHTAGLSPPPRGDDLDTFGTNRSCCSSLSPHDDLPRSQSLTHSLSQRSQSSFASQNSYGGTATLPTMADNVNINFRGNGAESSEDGYTEYSAHRGCDHCDDGERNGHCGHSEDTYSVADSADSISSTVSGLSDPNSLSFVDDSDSDSESAESQSESHSGTVLSGQARRRHSEWDSDDERPAKKRKVRRRSNRGVLNESAISRAHTDAS